MDWLQTTGSLDGDGRDTGEHFLGAFDDESAGLVQVSARRIADLAAQIDFLDSETARYRDLLERERIRHSTEIAELHLQADTRLDDAHRHDRQKTQAVHDSYRALLHERQVEFDTALSAAAALHAAELADERRRHEHILEQEHRRREQLLLATRNQTLEEINQAHQRAISSLRSELARSTGTVARLQSAVASMTERAEQAEQQTERANHEAAANKRLAERLESQQHLRFAEAQKQVDAATLRLETERQRSAATLAELLERSAAIAAEADKARSDFAAEQARAERVAATAHQQAQQEYRELAEAADARASRAIEREIELEAAIAELRELLAQSSR